MTAPIGARRGLCSRATWPTSGTLTGMPAPSSLCSRRLGSKFGCQIIWAKQKMVIGRGDYHFQHEPCWYAVRKGKTSAIGTATASRPRWQIDKPQKSETGHSTQRPIECIKRPIENNTKPGDAVYEPFSGSGDHDHRR